MPVTCASRGRSDMFTDYQAQLLGICEVHTYARKEGPRGGARLAPCQVLFHSCPRFHPWFQALAQLQGAKEVTVQHARLVSRAWQLYLHSQMTTH